MSLKNEEVLSSYKEFFETEPLKGNYRVSEMMREGVPAGVLEIRYNNPIYSLIANKSGGSYYDGSVAYIDVSMQGMPEVTGPGSLLKNNILKLVANGLDDETLDNWVLKDPGLVDEISVFQKSSNSDSALEFLEMNTRQTGNNLERCHRNTIESVFENVRKNKMFGIVPAYNTLSGEATKTYNQMEKGGVKILSEIIIPAVFGLERQDTSIENHKKNMTEFWLIAPVETPIKTKKTKATGNDKTSLVYIPNKNVTGSTIDIMVPPYEERINVSRIYNKPISSTDFRRNDHIMHFDLDGHIDDEIIKKVIEEIKQNIEGKGELIELGSYRVWGEM